MLQPIQTMSEITEGFELETPKTQFYHLTWKKTLNTRTSPTNDIFLTETIACSTQNTFLNPWEGDSFADNEKWHSATLMFCNTRGTWVFCKLVSLWMAASPPTPMWDVGLVCYGICKRHFAFQRKRCWLFFHLIHEKKTPIEIIDWWLFFLRTFRPLT